MRDGRPTGRNRDIPVHRVAVHVFVCPEQLVAAEGVQLVGAVRGVHGRRGERPARRFRHLLMESLYPVRHSGRDDRAGR